MPSPLRIEFHCHTVHSMDGLMTVKSLRHTAQAIGLDVLAITDHDEIEGAFQLQKATSTSGLAIIVGEERTLDDGSHLIGLFLNRQIQASRLEDVVREIEGQGGICLIPHPFRRKDGLLRNGLEPLRCFQGRVAGFELFSAKCSFEENQKARQLLSHPNLGPFGGSDAHYECDLGESINVVTAHGDLRTTIQRMFERRTSFQILGKPQGEGEGERKYAPLYYRLKRHAQMPRFCLPAAKQVYRYYRNWKFGVGPKVLREVYGHA